MEQQFINVLIKLLRKAGAGSLISDLTATVEENGDPKAGMRPNLKKLLTMSIGNLKTSEQRKLPPS